MSVSIPRIPGLLGAIAASALLLGGCEQTNTYAPPPTVTVSQPVQRAVTDYIEFTGNTEAFETVEVRARVPGFLQSVHFEAGSMVKQGDLLYIIDPAPLQAALQKAEAELVYAKAQFGKAESEYLRRKQAFKKGAYAEAEVIAAKADRDAAKRPSPRRKRPWPRRGAAESGVHPDYGPDRRAHRQERSGCGQPRGPRRANAARQD